MRWLYIMVVRLVKLERLWRPKAHPSLQRVKREKPLQTTKQINIKNEGTYDIAWVPIHI